MNDVRARGDHGVAIVEMALVSPILFTLLLAVFEYGLVYRDILTAADAASDGARVGSQQGNDVLVTGATADYTIVDAVRMGLAGLDPESIERIVVYQAGPPSDGSPLSQVPAACRTGGSSTAADCNVYLPATAFVAIQDGDVEFFECVDAGDPACGWDPTTRVDGPTVADIEYLGVYVEVRHDYLTGLFGSAFDIERASITRIEPGDLSG
ncbi:TadE family protein [Rhabdothermincola salaria]|uniref:TadE family protein n=1 Tax=Rhabdothermincola salaria TaxID=2903142 RepID=UPI001E50F604|nr:TadE family protein [Rhabdothermincola salaria]MCD9622651.1 pilus assembly protein [Rhabdothermincola salaria]